ncbi:CRISPR-associated helicase/endonuclease Cas3 [Citrobacter rodentium]|uniref:CRISPR-associated helicase/endonuclease Cas3 n=1 Tax=Citrobacter rodentium TaxID=67825 RepID=A0A482PP89_CITRO|nr:CRISPR-associated helicase/endonuclease Cas3 [Citrobacter rodentium]KIQ51411.1 helicase [Citrobacter rodentium]QBY29476.1 CRISPR-associated helicase/endonuclease Cas3 [Citrobacter rodentium]UHO33128.1 CRISPR-associated helicase/endonuclease Cas3 [Citrobacter rodentium NBRC 105723 = DSM 16636]HAT8012516.1 CRISPR-associated helicase/endonuclease Cas3 [Citrobacter rodentium NBRC 105723 = DSM 16636]HAT8017816.1 CRISPR-associated helicase/endonuclease Cas3 [Citrobacter rodentium]
MSIFNFWGKTRQGEKDGGDDYHLLCWHSLDVAAVGYWMVKNNIYGLADHFRRLGMTDIEQAAQFFAWLLCWHDTGKFASSFQQLYSHPDLNVPAGRRQNYEKISHTTLGYWLWNTWLSDCPELFPHSTLTPRKLKRVIAMWMPLTTGHHGRPPDGVQELDNFLPQDKEAAREFLASAKALFPQIVIPSCWDEDDGIALFQQLSWLISAAVVLADWSGSSTRFFPRIASKMPVETYWQQALEKAKAALAIFPPSSGVAPFSGVNTLFPFIRQPTPLQQKVLTLDIHDAGAQLFILEDVTGAGKTEAALILTHRLMAAGKAKGLFFGLPTMATANAMFDRLAQSWQALYQPGSRPSLVLAHSARGLMDRFNQSIWSADLIGAGEPDERQGCAAWFADSNKKALLAEVGVGTLDQAMMAVMPFKHNNLRLLGLSNKILLADEIHAYDAYMSRILESLIENQARNGNTTILLSATLSQQQRDRLVAAFARGRGSHIEAPLLGHGDYPWLTQVTGTGVVSRHVATRKEVERCVKVGWLYSEQSCIERIEQAASEGQCIAWIRNSVDDAIRVYRQLIARGVIAAENISLFHSRFAFYDRQRIETETLSRFGKSESTQRAGKVLICTQVIESSVDIDMDAMISDLAPVDLLIQRAGRLQRHIRDRNGQLKNSGQDERDAPELLVLAPEWDEAPQEDWFSCAMRNSAYVYPDHGRLWLTQRVLREQGAIRMPQSARLLIESVYGESVVMPVGFAETEQKQEGKYYCDRAFATQMLLNFAAGYSSENSHYLSETLSTRLAEESVTLWLAKIVDGVVMPYALSEHPWEMSVVRVRQSWWGKHKGEFELLEGEALQNWCAEHYQDKDFTYVIIVTDSAGCGYSANEGLIGKGD